MLHFHLSYLAVEWEWTSSDSLISFLPLNHIHGLLNIVVSSLLNLTALSMHSAFDTYLVWTSITDNHRCPYIFMTVRSIYYHLVNSFSSLLYPAPRTAARIDS